MNCASRSSHGNVTDLTSASYPPSVDQLWCKVCCPRTEAVRCAPTVELGSAKGVQGTRRQNEGAGDLPALFLCNAVKLSLTHLPTGLDGMRIALTLHLQGEVPMYGVTVPDTPAQGVLPPSSMPETTKPGMTSGAKLRSSSEATAGYDADLLLAALEDIESRRAAIEWLLEADLLCVCLV
jgi:hypothetical protein